MTDPPAPGGAVAVMIGGTLPESWRPAWVVLPISRDDAIAEALYQGPGTVESADLGVELVDGSWRAVWSVVLRGAFPYHCPIPPSSDCGSHPGARIRVDAIGANVLSVDLLSE